MARLYIGFQTMGGREDVLKKLRLAVSQAKAAEVVPVIRIERRTRRRGRGEYYVFVAYETASARDARAKADAVLDLAAAKMNLTIQGTKRFYDLTLGGIGTIVEGEELQTEAVGGGGAWLHDPGDPYEYSGARPPDASDASAGDRYERLLQWMSAYGGGRWEMLARACAALDLAAERSHVWGIVRRMVLLGHVEFDYDAKRWSCCPPVISRTAQDPAVCVLAGARTVSLIDGLPALGEARVDAQPGHNGPPRIAVRTSDAHAAAAEDVTEIASVPLGRVGVASLRLAEVLPTLDRYPDALTPVSPPESAYNTYRIWDGQQYVDPPEPVYRQGNRYVGRTGLYRATPNNAAAGAFATYLFFDAPQQRFLKGEVQGLRFLARSTALRPDGLRPQARLNVDTSQLLVPDRERWPMLYERALVLASGLLPGRADNRDWLVYECVSRDLASLLAGKLNVELTEIRSPPTVAEPAAAAELDGGGATGPASAEPPGGNSPIVLENSQAGGTEPPGDPDIPVEEAKRSPEEPHREYWSSGDE